MVGIDALLNLDPAQDELLYDLQVGEDGDVVTEDQFETAVLVSLFSDRRAEPSQVPRPELRRGWVGDLQTPGDPIGSTLWLLEQSRLTGSTANAARDAAQVSLQWLVDDDFATAVATRSVVGADSLLLFVDVSKPNSQTESFAVALWERTGR